MIINLGEYGVLDHVWKIEFEQFRYAEVTLKIEYDIGVNGYLPERFDIIPLDDTVYEFLLSLGYWGKGYAKAYRAVQVVRVGQGISLLEKLAPNRRGHAEKFAMISTETYRVVFTRREY